MKTPLRIAFTGLKGSGKDTAAEVFTRRGYANVKFATPLKKMLYAFYESVGVKGRFASRKIDGDLKEVPCPYLNGQTPRWAMQSLGTEWGRLQISSTLWVDSAQRVFDQHHLIVVSDLRFENELEHLRKNGFVIYRIERSMDYERDLHASEQSILWMDVDHVLVNDFDSAEEFQEAIEAAFFPEVS